MIRRASLRYIRLPFSRRYITRPAFLQPSSRSAEMASDDDYMAFLDKANQDLSDGQARAAEQKNKQQSGPFKALDAGTQVPKAIRDVCQSKVYVSDADEPFEPVVLQWKEDLPDEPQFAKLIHHWDPNSADITIMDPLDWDAQGQYTEVIEAVREATKGNDVRVYKVVRDKTRVEHWVVGTDEGRVVGVKALGVES